MNQPLLQEALQTAVEAPISDKRIRELFVEHGYSDPLPTKESLLYELCRAAAREGWQAAIQQQPEPVAQQPEYVGWQFRYVFEDQNDRRADWGCVLDGVRTMQNNHRPYNADRPGRRCRYEVRDVYAGPVGGGPPALQQKEEPSGWPKSEGVIVRPRSLSNGWRVTALYATEVDADLVAEALMASLSPAEKPAETFDGLFRMAHAWAQECYFKGLGRSCDVDGKRGEFAVALRLAFPAMGAEKPAEGERKEVGRG